ncbi:Tim44 domain-containing protein [Ochrobactrum pecoris]|uniref:Lipid-binding transport protein (Tim44 family) n=1 Tax=Brucella pecoris TaxID=867683 RepID=A0A5C5CNS8_9HYPH|nr:Tim44/TimA family putative adaptor protein [Brucella pecoris]MBB4093805.1 putative lipid-binding transport protein (Tim44 family) [Brucella pecoris]NKW79316.1 Tim44 domain-containing protein [Brucella pecoris]TNV12824.1 Tim44 domain-containing protein [Brucella pecoris]
MEFFDFGTIFFFIAAVIIFLQLRNVLGRRTGSEKPPFDPYTSARSADAAPASGETDNVVSLPRRPGEKDFTAIDKAAPAGTPINDGLRAIYAVDPAFDPASFVDGVKIAYEMIVMSYADGDRKVLKNLLSKDVFEGFVSAIDERETRGESVRSSFVGIDKAEITGAEMKGSEAHVTVNIVSQMISSTYDKDGKLIDGDPENVLEIKDLWTFARDTRSRDPNWKLVATEAED